MQLGSQQSQQLKLIFHLQEPSVPEEGIDIVVIPGVFTQYSVEKRKEACSWLKPLVAATSNDTRVFFYNYVLDVHGPSLWRQLLDHGPVFFDALRTIRQGRGYQQRPLLFICHSLGGLILKRALGISNQLHEPFEDVTCGIIFLGTPHLTSEDDKRWDNWAMILKSNRKDVSRNSLTNNDIHGLSNCCQTFAKMDLHSSILSIYETRTSKIRENLLQSLASSKDNRKMILVDESLSRIGAKHEVLFPVDATHNDLVLVPVDGVLYGRLVEFFRDVTASAPGKVALAFQRIEDEERLALRSRTSVGSFAHFPDQAPVEAKKLVIHATSRGESSQSSKALDTPSKPPNFDNMIKFPNMPVLMIKSIFQNPEFVGREELMKQIDAVLLPVEGRSGPSSLRSVALCGMGGIGKTECAIEYVLSRKDKFDAIFWISADTNRKLSNGFTEISRELGLEDSTIGYTDEVATREIVKGWMATPRKAAKDNKQDAEPEEAMWLLVLDNADDPSILYDWWPEIGTGAILITSRDPLAKETPCSITLGIDMPLFSNEEGGRLLSILSKREKEKNSAQLCAKICETLGGLPLAITQMGGVIRRRHYSLKDFIEAYAEDAKRLQEMRLPQQQLGYNQTVASVWAVEGLPAPALALLKVLSLLDPDRIPELILNKGAKDVDLPAYPKKKTDYFDARYELIHDSLITRNIDLEELRIHRLVQDVVREKLDEDELQAMFENVVTLISAVWPFTTFEKRNQVFRWPIYETYFPHVARLRDLFGANIKSGEFRASLQAAALFNDAAWYMIERASPKENLSFSELSQVIVDGSDAEGDVEVEKRMNRLLTDSHHHQSVAAQLLDDGELSMIHCKAQLGLVLERISRWNDPQGALDLALVYNNLALSYIVMKDVAEALKTWELSYDSFRNSDTAGVLGCTWPAVSLGIVYSQEGKPDQGEVFLEPVFKEREKLLGKDDKTSYDSGATWRSMGHIRVAQGRYDEGLELHQRALDNLRVTLGETHYQTADCMYNVAQSLIRRRDYSKASDLLDQALKSYGGKSWYKSSTARTLWRKGRLLRDMDKDIEADLFLKQAMSLRRELVPDDDRSEEKLVERDWDDLMFYHSR